MKRRDAVLLGAVLLAAAGLAWFLFRKTPPVPAVQEHLAKAQVAVQEARAAVAEEKVIEKRMAPRQERIHEKAVQVLAPLPPGPEVEPMPEVARELATEVLAQEVDFEKFKASVERANLEYEVALDHKDEAIKILEKEAAKPRMTVKKVVVIAGISVGVTLGVVALVRRR